MSNSSHPELLRAVAASGLAGAVFSLPNEPLAEPAWRLFIRGINEQRLDGHLAEAVATGALRTTAAQADEVAERHAAAMARVLQLERLLLLAVALLEGAGIEYRVMKGSALAHTAYADPAIRVFGDVDLLVPSEAFDAAAEVFSRAGWQRRWPQLRPGFDRRFGKGATFITPEGQEVDLHRTFSLGPFGLTVNLPALFATSTTFVVGGRRLHTLAGSERLMLACYHAAIGNASPRLVPLRDVAQLLLTPDAPSTEHVLELAQQWRSQAVVARAVTLTWRHFRLADVLPLSVWAQRYEPDRRERRALGSYHDPRRSFGTKALASLRVIEGLSAKASYLKGVVLPERRAIADYEASYVRWWRRGTTALLHRGAER